MLPRDVNSFAALPAGCRFAIERAPELTGAQRILAAQGEFGGSRLARPAGPARAATKRLNLREFAARLCATASSAPPLSEHSALAA